MASRVVSTIVLLICFLGGKRVQLEEGGVYPALPVYNRVFTFKLPSYVVRITTTVLRVRLGGTIINYRVTNINDRTTLDDLKVILQVDSMIISVYIKVTLKVRPVVKFGGNTNFRRQIGRACGGTINTTAIISIVN